MDNRRGQDMSPEAGEKTWHGCEEALPAMENRQLRREGKAGKRVPLKAAARNHPAPDIRFRLLGQPLRIAEESFASF